jgi:hypothetical protein
MVLVKTSSGGSFRWDAAQSGSVPDEVGGPMPAAATHPSVTEQPGVKRRGIGSVSVVAWAADGRAAFVDDTTGVLYVWDGAPDSAPRRVGNVRATALAFWPTSKSVLAGEADGTLTLWEVPGEGDAESGRKPRRTFPGHAAKIRQIAVSPDGSCAVTASDDTVRVWDLNRPVRCRELEKQVAKARERLDLSPGDPVALETFARWYDLRGRPDLAAKLRPKSAANQAAPPGTVSARPTSPSPPVSLEFRKVPARWRPLPPRDDQGASVTRDLWQRVSIE